MMGVSPIPFPDEETDMDVHDRGMLYYRLLKHDVTEVSVATLGYHGDVRLVDTNP